MTDEQIIKALERCFSRGFDESTCYECPFYTATAKCTEDLRDSALDLINRQKAEIRQLKKEQSRALNCVVGPLVKNTIKTAKKSAIKEFAERLKETAYSHSDISGYQSIVVDADTIDNLVEEMTEVQE